MATTTYPPSSGGGGVNQVHPGTGISVTGTTADPIVNNTILASVNRELILRPGVTADPAQGVFDNWPSLYTALGAIDGPVTLSFDANAGMPLITAGAWNLSQVVLFQGLPGVLPQLDIDPAAVISPPSPMVLQNLFVSPTNEITAPVIVFSGSGSKELVLRNAYMKPGDSSSSPLIKADHVALKTSLFGDSYIQSDNGFALIQADHSTQYVVLSDISSAYPFSITNLAGSTITFFFRSLKVSYPLEVQLDPFNSYNVVDQVGVAALGPNYIFRPGGVASGNVYTDWSSLYSAVTSVTGPRVIQIDNSIVSPCVVPPGTWDMTDITWVGRLGLGAADPGSDIVISDGAVLNNLCRIIDFVDVEGQSSSPCLVYSIPGEIVFLGSGCHLQNTGASPMIDIGAGGGMVFVAQGGVVLNAGTEVFNLSDASAEIILVASEAGQYDTNILSGVVGSTAPIDYTSSSGVFNPAQTNFFGTTFPIYNANHDQQINLTTGDPHTQYQLKSDKDVATGYAGLDADGLVPLIEAPPFLYIFRPGGIARGNVFVDWPSLYAAISVETGYRVVQFDCSISSPCNIPSGTYDQSNVVWTGLPGVGTDITTGTHIVLQDGCVVQNLGRVDRFIRLETQSSTPALTFPDSGFVFTVGFGSQVVSSGTAVLIDRSNPSTDFFIILEDGSEFDFSGFEVLNVGDPTSEVIIGIGGLAEIQSDTISGVAGVTVIALFLSAGGFVDFSQTNLAGSLVPFFDASHTRLSDLTTGDPHTQYQLRSEKDALSGYPGLDGGGQVSASVLWTFDTVASANDLVLTPGKTTLSISGATQINAIDGTGWNQGAVAVLIFSGAPLVKHNTAGGAGTFPLKLNASADFQANPDSVLSVVFDGAFWQEVSRKDPV